jgi:hypothetical protein
MATVTHRTVGRLWPAALLAALGTAGLWLLWRFHPADWGLPLCTFYSTTGLYCPGCGGTRATHELLHGHLLAALHDNALWVAALPLVLYAAASQGRLLLFGRPLWGDPATKPWCLIALGVATLAFFVLRNVPVYPWTLLVPAG